MTLSKMLTFLIRKFGGQKTVGQCVQRAKRKNCRSRILYPVKLFFKSEGVIKTFLAKKKKAREFIYTRPCLEEMLKGVPAR